MQIYVNELHFYEKKTFTDVTDFYSISTQNLA